MKKNSIKLIAFGLVGSIVALAGCSNSQDRMMMKPKSSMQNQDMDDMQGNGTKRNGMQGNGMQGNGTKRNGMQGNGMQDNNGMMQDQDECVGSSCKKKSRYSSSGYQYN